MISIPLVFSQPYPCSYLENEIARPVFVHPAFGMTIEHYSELIQQGFRRSGDEVYAPRCWNCSACIPVRLLVSNFVPNRSQKRCLKKNKHTQVEVKSPEFSQEQYHTYLRYQKARHVDGSMANSSADEYMGFLSSSWCDTVLVEFSVDGKIAAIAVVDRLENALSAVYTFFDPDFNEYGLGVYAVLWQIDWAKHLQKEYLYLGFWIKDCKKMSYKNKYQPLQVFLNHQWQSYENSFLL